MSTGRASAKKRTEREEIFFFFHTRRNLVVAERKVGPSLLFRSFAKPYLAFTARYRRTKDVYTLPSIKATRGMPWRMTYTARSKESKK